MVFIGPISSIFDVVTLAYVACVRRQRGRTAIDVSVGLVRRRAADADAYRAHDPHSAYSVHPESRGVARHFANGEHHGVWHLSAVLIVGRAFGNGSSAAVVFPVARWDPAELLRTDATCETSL